MKLALLAFEIVRDSIEFPSGITEEGFIRGDYDNDRDFSAQISSAFNYINLAFSRLVTSKKTILKVTTAAPYSTGYIEFTLGNITAIVDTLHPDYTNVRNTPYSNGVAIESKFIIPFIENGKNVTDSSGNVVYLPLYIEYRPKVPHFDLESIRKQGVDENNEEEIQEIEINLEDYGITDEMVPYIKEYCKGGLIEYLSPDLSQKHYQIAESYFADLKTQYTHFPQRHVDTSIGGSF